MSDDLRLLAEGIDLDLLEMSETEFADYVIAELAKAVARWTGIPSDDELMYGTGNPDDVPVGILSL